MKVDGQLEGGYQLLPEPTSERGIMETFRGDGAEKVAEGYLTQVAFPLGVLRQADIGVDIQCSIRDDTPDYRQEGAQFDVQIKSGADASHVDYGGIKKGVSQIHRVIWLLGGRVVPFFIGVMPDDGPDRLLLYSTMRMWHIRWQFGFPSGVRLIPGDDQLSSKHRQHTYRNWDKSKHRGDGLRRDVPLGPPIVELRRRMSVPDIAQAKEVIRAWTMVDEVNRVFARFGVPTRWTFTSWTTGQLPDPANLRRPIYWNSTPGMNIVNIRSILDPLIDALAANYEAQNNLLGLSKVSQLMSDMPWRQYPGWHRERWTHEYRGW